MLSAISRASLVFYAHVIIGIDDLRTLYLLRVALFPSFAHRGDFPHNLTE